MALSYLSAILAGRILSIMMAFLPLRVAVVRHKPSEMPGVLSISTSSGPVAFSTASVHEKISEQQIDIAVYTMRASEATLFRRKIVLL